MKTQKLLMKSAAASLLMLALGQAHATVFNLDLTGTVADGSFGSYNSGSTHYDYWTLNLSGLDASNAITVGVGDTINATINLDQSFTVPQSVNITWMGFTVGGSSFPSINTATTNDSVAFFNGGVAGPSGTGSNCSSSGSLPSCNLFYPPNNSSFTFDHVIASFDISTLGTVPGQTAVLNNANLNYFLFSPVTPVPEPETFAMLLAGLGIMGGVALRRNAKQV